MIPDYTLAPEIVYFLKVNAAFALFYAFYRLFFYKDTFFKLRRTILLAFFALAFLYPLMNFQEWVKEQPPIAEMVHIYSAILLPEVTVTGKAAEAAVNWGHVFRIGLAGLYIAGVAVLLIRFFLQLSSILWLARISRKTRVQGVKVYALPKPCGPFSFFRMIFLHPGSHQGDETAEILAHEKTHVVQGHSFDVILSELLSILCWINPFVWLLKREVRHNLEYLADHTVIQSGYDSKSYQYHLLGLAHYHHQAAANLYNSFNVLHLKNRISMMNKKRSRGIGRTKYLMFLPLAGLLMLFSNIEAIARITYPPTVTAEEDIRQEISSDASHATISNKRSADQNQASAAAQRVKVKAKVVSMERQPLAKVTVKVLDSKEKTVTDAKGNFTLEVPAQAVLELSCPGKIKREIRVEDIGKDEQILMMPAGKLSAPTSSLELVIESLDDPSDPVYKVAENMPVYPGGDIALLQFVAKNIKYPIDAQTAGIQGRVICSFVVNKKGIVTKSRVVRGVSPSLDAEALRVIGEFPQWTPGTVGGEVVSVKYTVPITFRLQ